MAKQEKGSHGSRLGGKPLSGAARRNRNDADPA
jgi:hypothetical protein